MSLSSAFSYHLVVRFASICHYKSLKKEREALHKQIAATIDQAQIAQALERLSNQLAQIENRVQGAIRKF